MENQDEREVLLRVEHLCQYFKSGNFELKAVDDVSFDIKKGEVFGLVGESGCGKTTTGRSIIKLYNITSGSVYFKGRRICAGIRSYKLELKELKKQ
ncbi:MAG: ATP-binding cassette domain-containing protein, partial [Christensenellaceae bacterium]